MQVGQADQITQLMQLADDSVQSVRRIASDENRTLPLGSALLPQRGRGWGDAVGL